MYNLCLSIYFKSERKVELSPEVRVKPTLMSHYDRRCKCGMTTPFCWPVLLFIDVLATEGMIIIVKKSDGNKHKKQLKKLQA